MKRQKIPSRSPGAPVARTQRQVTSSRQSTRTSISTSKVKQQQTHSKKSSDVPHFGNEELDVSQPQRESVSPSTSISLAELNKKFFYNPTQTPRKMAQFSARRGSNHTSPNLMQSRNKASFQVSRMGSTALSKSALPSSQSVSASLLFSDFKGSTGDRPSPKKNGLRLVPTTQQETPKNIRAAVEMNLPRQMETSQRVGDRKSETKRAGMSGNKPGQLGGTSRLRELEENNRKYQNILISLQKKNSFLEEELKKMHERSKLEKEKTYNEIEQVSQNYRKYAEYYKKYLSEKNDFERAKRDLVTMHLRVENTSKFLHDLSEKCYATVQNLQQVQVALRRESVNEKNTQKVDQVLGGISEEFLQKLQELEQAPLGVSFGERAREMYAQQIQLNEAPLLGSSQGVLPPAQSAMLRPQVAPLKKREESPAADELAQQEYYRRNIAGYVRRHSPEKEPSYQFERKVVQERRRNELEIRAGIEPEEVGRNLSPIMKGQDNRTQIREEELERGRANPLSHFVQAPYKPLQQAAGLGRSESFTLSDYYNDGAAGMHRPLTPPLQPNLRTETPSSLHQQQRAEENRDISLMSTIRALNNELNKIEENEANRAAPPQQQNYNAGSVSHSSQSGGVRSNGPTMVQIQTSSSRTKLDSHFLYDSSEASQTPQIRLPGEESQKASQSNTATGTPQFEKDIRNAFLGGAMKGQESVMESLSRAKREVPAIRLTKVEFSGEEESNFLKEIPGRKLDSEVRLALLGGMGVAQSTKNLTRDNDGAATLHPRSPASEPDTTKKIEIAVALYDFEAQRDGDLSFKQGQQILILTRKDQHNWWYGSMGQGREGWFPKNFVKVEALTH